MPFELDPHPVALAVIERDSVIFKEKKLAVGSGVNGNGKWAVDFLINVLFDWAERKNGACADEERKSFQVHGAIDFAAAVVGFVRPKIEPALARKIQTARRRAFLDDGRHENVAPPQIFVAALYSFGIVGIMQPRAAHHGDSSESGFAYSAIQIRHQAIAQLQVFAANRLDLRIVQFAGIGESRTTVAADFRRANFAGVPSPGQAELPGTAVATEKRAKSTELEPTQVKFGCKFFCGNEAAYVGSPIRNAG